MLVKLKPESNLKSYHLTNDKFYKSELRKTKYNDWFIIKCDDGLTREFSTLHFISIEDIRDQKLKNLGL